MKHLDENTIQAFLDGELPDEALLGATTHLADCENCTELLLRAEAEIAEISLAFAAENSSPCPTQRIWARIENEIEVCAWQPKKIEVEQKSFWTKFAEFFTPAQIGFAGAFAAVVLVSLVSLSFFEQQLDRQSNEIALEQPQISGQNLTSIAIPEDSSSKTEAETFVRQNENQAFERAPRAIRASFEAPRATQNQRLQRSKLENQKSAALLDGEKDYLNTIAELSKSVAASDEAAMRPSFRVEYERNAAMLDQAIAQMQKQARRHPQNENARRILFASYQNKIDLLSAVSEKSQLVASMQ